MTYTVTMTELDEQQVAVVRGKARQDEISQFLGSAFQHVATTAASQGLQIVGPPFGRYRPIDDSRWEIEAGFPVSASIEASRDVEPDVLPGGTVAQTMHVGPYDGIGAAYEATIGYLENEGYRQTGDPWESYLDGPEVAEPRTLLFVPCTLQ